MATAAWHYPSLFSSIFSFFWSPRSPSLIPLAQSMTPSKPWQNKERPLSITLCCAEMSSGVCLLRLKGLHEWWWEHNSGSVHPEKNKWFTTHLIFLPFFSLSLSLSHHYWDFSQIRQPLITVSVTYIFQSLSAFFMQSASAVQNGLDPIDFFFLYLFIPWCQRCRADWPSNSMRLVTVFTFLSWLTVSKGFYPFDLKCNSCIFSVTSASYNIVWMVLPQYTPLF